MIFVHVTVGENSKSAAAKRRQQEIMKHNKINNVPTNLITGFLGVGKTSAMLHLLRNKPTNERWAILVNEFGEIGVDGSLLTGQYSEEQGVFVREVPGGCMCCAAGVPMKIALNQLLIHAKPDRLLIEPTGLGHPQEILKVLTSEHYQDVLLLEKTVTLVDARNLADKRYTSHDIFNQQIAIADIVIGNKVELYENADKEALKQYVKHHGQANAEVIFSTQGQMPITKLAGPPAATILLEHHHHVTTKSLIADAILPECGFLKAMNSGEGFYSVGWRFSINIVFNHSKLIELLKSIKADRIKAVFNTNLGALGYNISENTLTETKLNTIKESRIEIISDKKDDSIEAQLMDCIHR
ncbi:CobW family GTP-binding protein [Colwellia sp. 20A7]|uniref:CobW family GTP-binding protein n=1 Tax=Colwellia sp. 20A7 TaxID=2689569 RepID=UPI001F34A2D0|nr:GTP-binding protein [Colwellia sp. 20A7]